MRIEPAGIDVVVLAGGVNKIALYDGYQPGYKALVDFGGRPSIQYVLRALRQSRYVFGVLRFHFLTLQQMARIASRRFDIGILPVPVPYPEVALDVDEPGDYTLVQEILSA